MKRSELREIIKEEIVRVLTETDDGESEESDNLDYINKLAKKDIALLKPGEFKKYVRQPKMPQKEASDEKNKEYDWNKKTKKKRTPYMGEPEEKEYDWNKKTKKKKRAPFFDPQDKRD